MALSASQELQQRKEQKFKRELTRALSRLPSKNVDAFIGSYFSKYPYTLYSNDMFIDIVTASKFGGVNAVAQGGILFVLENILAMLKSRVATRNILPLQLEPVTGQYFEPTYKYDYFFNIFALGQLDNKLVDHIDQISLGDLVCHADISPNLFLDNETSSYGFVIYPHRGMKLADLASFFHNGGHTGLSFEGMFEGDSCARLKIPNLFDSGRLE